MRTPEQILHKLEEEKRVIEVLMGQLYAQQDKTYLYHDTLNFMADGVRSLDNATKELRDILLK